MFKFKQDKNMQILFWGGFSFRVTILYKYAIKTLLLNWKANSREKDFKSHVGKSRQSFGERDANFLCFAKTGLSP